MPQPHEKRQHVQQPATGSAMLYLAASIERSLPHQQGVMHGQKKGITQHDCRGRGACARVSQRFAGGGVGLKRTIQKSRPAA